MENPRVSEAVQIEELGTEVIVCNPGTSRICHLNELAALILYHCDGSRSPDEIAQEIERMVRGAEPGALERDVRRTLEELRQEKVIV